MNYTDLVYMIATKIGWHKSKNISGRLYVVMNEYTRSFLREELQKMARGEVFPPGEIHKIYSTKILIDNEIEDGEVKVVGEVY